MDEERQVPQAPQEFPQTEPALEVEPPKNNKNLIISILTILLVIAVASIAYLMFFQSAVDTSLTEEKKEAFGTSLDVAEDNSSNSEVNNEEDQAISGATEESSIPDGWIVYENKELGFRILHPSDYEVREIIDSVNRLINLQSSSKDSSVTIRLHTPHSSVIALGKDFTSFLWLDQMPDTQKNVGNVIYNVYSSETGYGDGPGFSQPYLTYLSENSNPNEYIVIEFKGDAILSDTEKRILESFEAI